MGIDDDNKNLVTTGTFQVDPSAFNITFHGSQPQKTYLTITPDGRLIPGDGLSADEATQFVAKLLAENYGRQMLRIRKEEEDKSA